MKTVLVLGIAGFSGRHFERYVQAENLAAKWKFIGVDRDLHAAEATGLFSYHHLDATDAPLLKQFLHALQPSYIVNLAGAYRPQAFLDLVRVNVGISESILSACADGGISPERILLIGSAAELGEIDANPATETSPVRPVSSYGLTKVFQTELAAYFFRTKGVPVAIARTFNLLGDDVPPELAAGRFRQLVESAKDGEEIRVGNLESRRDYIEVDRAIALYWKILTLGIPGQTYNVCSGTTISMRQLLERMVSRSGKRLSIVSEVTLLKQNDVSHVVGSTAKLMSLDGEGV